MAVGPQKFETCPGWGAKSTVRLSCLTASRSWSALIGQYPGRKLCRAPSQRPLTISHADHKGPTAGRVLPPDYLRLEYLFSSASSLDAAAGGRVSLMTRSLLEMVFPYKSLFHSSSWRSVAPSSDKPAKSPRARE